MRVFSVSFGLNVSPAWICKSISLALSRAICGVSTMASPIFFIVRLSGSLTSR